ncbi:hypothetical protein XELAEV_18001907mg [Xenopus laevis]|nr:hypothetical protein XELAEV_18001907mg [Xenopus laevis]
MLGTPKPPSFWLSCIRLRLILGFVPPHTNVSIVFCDCWRKDFGTMIGRVYWKVILCAH